MARVDAVLGQHGRERRHVLEGRALAELHPHPGAQLGKRVLAVRRLVARVDAGGDVCLQAVIVPAGEAPVAGDRLARLERRGDLGVDLLVPLDHAGHVHHLAESDRTLPAERLADLRRAERGAGVLETGQRGHARRHGEEDLQRQVASLVEEPAHAFEPEDVRHLVVVDERSCCPARQHSLGEAGDGDHHRLDMQVSVDQARDEVGALGVDRLGGRADRVRDVAEQRDTAMRDRDVDTLLHLARVHVDEPSVADHELGRLAPHRDRSQHQGELGERSSRHGRETLVGDTTAAGR